MLEKVRLLKMAFFDFKALFFCLELSLNLNREKYYLQNIMDFFSIAEPFSKEKIRNAMFPIYDILDPYL